MSTNAFCDSGSSPPLAPSRVSVEKCSRTRDNSDNVALEANSGLPLKGDFERMAKRRFQNPKPTRRGDWWTLRVWKDTFTKGEHHRTRECIRLAPATMGLREVQKVADECLRPLNQGLETIGSATNFRTYVENTYKPVVMPGLAKSTQVAPTAC